MKLRPTQFVYLVILLSTLRLAEAATLPHGDRGATHHALGELLNPDGSGLWTQATLVDQENLWGATVTMVELRLLPAHPTVVRMANPFATQFIPFQTSPDPARHNLPVPTDLGAQALRTTRTPWSMRPPSAHCVALQSVTGFGDPYSPFRPAVDPRA